jgi:hypothetical protein
VAGGWRRLHNEELHNLYASLNIIRTIKCKRIRWAGNVARIEAVRNAYKMLIGISEGKRPLRRPRECVAWIHLAQARDQWRNTSYPYDTNCSSSLLFLFVISYHR